MSLDHGKSQSLKIVNTTKDITNFLSNCKDFIIFYEPTGIYSNKLCKACNDLGVVHYQVNPFVVYRILDGLGDRNKTDKIDAGKIAQIGKMLLDMYNSNQNRFKLIFPSSNEICKMDHFVSIISSIRNQISRFKQTLERLNEDVYSDTTITDFYQKQLEIFQDEKDRIHLELQKTLINMWYGKVLENIASMPSINEKFGSELVAFFIKLVSKWIEKGDKSKLKAFIGIDPNERSSGTSLNKVRISRRWNKNMRCMFFMAGMKRYQLINYDKYAKTDIWKFFVRMKNKFTIAGSKHGKRVIMAMAKKLLLVAWGIFWNDTEYDRRK